MTGAVGSFYCKGCGFPHRHRVSFEREVARHFELIQHRSLLRHSHRSLLGECAGHVERALDRSGCCRGPDLNRRRR